MLFQTIEIHGERYVILSERDFLALQPRVGSLDAEASNHGNGVAKFRDVVPLKVSGPPASELLLRDRR